MSKKSIKNDHFWPPPYFIEKIPLFLIKKGGGKIAGKNDQKRGGQIQLRPPPSIETPPPSFRGIPGEEKSDFFHEIEFK